jgi:hypothetical protein
MMLVTHAARALTNLPALVEIDLTGRAACRSDIIDES